MKTTEQKYTFGDICKIVNYGHKMYNIDINGKYSVIDISPEYIGREVMIDHSSSFMNGLGSTVYTYSTIYTDSASPIAWLHEDQLEFVRVATIEEIKELKLRQR